MIHLLRPLCPVPSLSLTLSLSHPLPLCPRIIPQQARQTICTMLSSHPLDTVVDSPYLTNVRIWSYSLSRRESILAANVTFPTYLPKVLYIPHSCLRTRNLTKTRKKKPRSEKPRSHIRTVNAEKYTKYPCTNTEKKRKGCNSSTCTCKSCTHIVSGKLTDSSPRNRFKTSPSSFSSAPLSTYLYLTYLTYTYLGGTCNMGGALFSCMC